MSEEGGFLASLAVCALSKASSDVVLLVVGWVGFFDTVTGLGVDLFFVPFNLSAPIEKSNDSG